MSEQMTEKMNRFFGERIAGCERRQAELNADERGDEAVFEKIRANVYDIFRTVLSAAGKACKGDARAAGQFFSDRLDQIPAGWAAAYENAREHDDVDRMQIERVKLDAIADIREYFDKVREEEA